MSIIVDQEFFANAPGFNFEPFGTIGSEAYDFTNDPIARDFNGCEVAIQIKCGCERARARRD
jgi:hypothetical protein